jgi:hypothetical protein
MRWVIAFLALCAGFMGFIVYQVLHVPSSGTKFMGGFFLVIGAMNSLFYKSSGRKFYATTQRNPPYFARFWARFGERGIQFFHLGIGIIFTVAGCVLIVLGTA